MADVLFVAPDLAPGGVGRCVAFIVDALPGHGLETGLFLLRRHRQAYAVANSRVAHALAGTPPGWRLRASLPLALWRLLRHLRRDPPAVVCSHGLMCNLLVAAARLLSRQRFASVAFEHNSPAVCYSGSALRRAARWAVRLAYPRHSLVVGVSRGVARDLAAMFPALRRKCRHLYNGVPLDEVRRQGAGAGPAPPPGVLQVVCIGRLDVNKDYATLVEAARLLDDPGIAFTVLGDGPQREALQRQLAARPSRSRVTLAGHADNPFPILARAGLFVSTSLRESFGIALVEALCLGVPVIAADCPHGPAEILAGGRYGVLVPMRDAAALAAAIRRLADDPAERRRLAEEGPARAAAFSLDQHCRNAASLFNPLL
ncbi:glycosyltransferase [Pigmentiphaga soli]|uniref:Glycosyltransferase n=1 Tax=Pigmentiphaga soli TaxID=1007095 RepID=A0ABP8GVK6_9BURK